LLAGSFCLSACGSTGAKPAAGSPNSSDAAAGSDSQFIQTVTDSGVDVSGTLPSELVALGHNACTDMQLGQTIDQAVQDEASAASQASHLSHNGVLEVMDAGIRTFCYTPYASQLDSWEATNYPSGF
jgi:hypothetical protein